MSRILFIHQNFPGQFRHLAPALVRTGHEVRALHMRAQVPDSWLGVSCHLYQPVQGPVPGQHPWLQDMQSKVLRGQGCLAAMRALHAQGFEPDLVIAHIGWGEALFVREAWPRTRLAVYAEFFYRLEGADVNFDPEFASVGPEAMARLRLRNAPQLLQLETADAVIAPTRWQAQTYPQPWRDRIDVIHEGVSTALLRPDPAVRWTVPGLGLTLGRGDEVVTFVSRHLEPYRGFHSFMRSLPEMLAARPNARVLVVGAEGVSYGAPPPDGRSWQQIYADEVRPRMTQAQWDRVHFLGRIPYNDFRAVLALSTVHVYLTYPFVLSWSLLEAMSMGCAIVASRTGPVCEVIEHDRQGRLVDFFDPRGLAAEVVRLLADSGERSRLGAAARERAVAHYDLEKVCLPQQEAWVRHLLG